MNTLHTQTASYHYKLEHCEVNFYNFHWSVKCQSQLLSREKLHKC